MFGYIRPFKPRMQFYEYEIYHGFYCGLCKELGRNYGQIFRFTLSYDFAFLGMLYNSYHGDTVKMQRQRCVAHPLRKKNCLCCGSDLDYTCAAAVISVYHKVCDEISDSGFIRSLFFRAVRRLIKKGYKKAEKLLPRVAAEVDKYMKMQSELERENCPSIDRACEPTAKIMSVIAGNISDKPEDRERLSAFGYHLGRFIYIADAYDDIEKDKKNRNYNPLLINFSDVSGARQFAMDNINMSLAQAAEHYAQCGFKKFKGIIDNVVYLGLPNFRSMNRSRLRRNRNKQIEI